MTNYFEEQNFLFKKLFIILNPAFQSKGEFSILYCTTIKDWFDFLW